MPSTQKIDKEKFSYEAKLARYTKTLRNEKADMVPLRPFVAEFFGAYAGKTCQQVTHDYTQAFDSVIKMCKDFNFDAFVGNQIHLWSGLTQALGVKYYAVPGMDIKPDVGFQYLEPEEDESFMREDEYDELIDDPTAFLYNKWFPRISTVVGHKDKDGSFYKSQVALVKGAMALMQYRMQGALHVQRMKNETQTPTPFCGTFKAPLDIIGDKLRGYLGLTMDLFERPEKVLKACEALMPYLCNVSLRLSDPNNNLPISFWMHRGGKPFVSEGIFESHYWATTKPIVEEFFRRGKQTLFYAEGAWHYHFDSFRELPDASIIYHADRDDIFETHKRLGDKFCLSGGLPNTLLSFDTPQNVRSFTKKIITEVAANGGYVMDSSAIMQNDTKIENFSALCEACREYGVYSSSHSTEVVAPLKNRDLNVVSGMSALQKEIEDASYITTWQDYKDALSKPILGDETLCEKIWCDIEKMGTNFIWQMLLCF